VAAEVNHKWHRVGSVNRYVPMPRPLCAATTPWLTPVSLATLTAGHRKLVSMFKVLCAGRSTVLAPPVRSTFLVDSARERPFWVRPSQDYGSRRAINSLADRAHACAPRKRLAAAS